MSKTVYIAEKPMVARAFAEVLGEPMTKKDGYQEGDNSIVTWCVGHLVTMSYPEVYDEKYRKWRLDTLPFLPEEFKYEVIPGVKKQFEIVKSLLTRDDVDKIYVCTDSGREGEYIYRLVAQEAQVSGKDERRVWIDSQTEEEIKRGIREAKPLSEYDKLSDSAYLRAKEDYLMGINFSRLLTIRYGRAMADFLGEKYSVISVGRVMTCVLGMVVKRERAIREFVKTPFYKPVAVCGPLNLEWKAVETSEYFNSPLLYKDIGFLERPDAEKMLSELGPRDENGDLFAEILEISKKSEKKNPPLLYNLAELQNEASKVFKIPPDKTLEIVQSLYEKKLVTYPRTDARVLSTAVAKEIHKNLNGLCGIRMVEPFVRNILDNKLHEGIVKSKYTNDSQITDHYAIIPTGSGLGAMKGLDSTSLGIYEMIVRRFVAIFLPAAVYDKLAVTARVGDRERFFYNDKVLKTPGYLEVMNYSFSKKNEEESGEKKADPEFVKNLKKGAKLKVDETLVKEGETKPPKRYTSGSIILAMENAGNLIEDEELREQIKSNGIGTSATRAGILEKLIKNKYLNLNKKTQVITPTLTGEMIFDVVSLSIRSLLNPELTASWEKGLNLVASGEISSDEYMEKLESFIKRNTDKVISSSVAGSGYLHQVFGHSAAFYKTGSYGGIKKKGNSK